MDQPKVIIMNNDDLDLPVRIVPEPEMNPHHRPEDLDLPVNPVTSKTEEIQLSLRKNVQTEICDKIRDRRNKNLVMVLFTILGFGLGFGSIYGGFSILDDEKGISRIIGFLFGLGFGIVLIRGTWEMLGKE